MPKAPQIQTRLTAEVRKAVDAQLVLRRQATGDNVTLSDWLREAAEEKLARDVKTKWTPRVALLRAELREEEERAREEDPQHPDEAPRQAPRVASSTSKH